MAFSVTSLYAGISSMAATVTMTIDPDPGGTITHGITVATPLLVSWTPLVGAAHVGQDAVGLPGATTLAYSKAGIAGSGNAAARALVAVSLPHSLVK